MSEPITRIKTPLRLEFTVSAGSALTRFLEGMAEKRIIGRRAPHGKVYVPPRGCCPMTGELTVEDVELPHTGTVTTFCVINIPFEGQLLTPPYVAAAIILDGADVPLFHLIAGCDLDDVRMGMRVEAVWVADEDLAPTLESIRYFAPTGEPDAAFETYQEHL